MIKLLLKYHCYLCLCAKKKKRYCGAQANPAYACLCSSLGCVAC
uniref:Uncharacterized protein n=1 Tax=Rhizophora mucronata TaxID=61149 RepID=A0A2P2Q6T2_RHIMU